MEVPQYNAALLCDENEHFQHATSVDCAMRYYNHSAALGWVFCKLSVHFGVLLVYYFE